MRKRAHPTKMFCHAGVFVIGSTENPVSTKVVIIYLENQFRLNFRDNNDAINADACSRCPCVETYICSSRTETHVL